MVAIHMYSGGAEIYWDCPFGIDEVFNQPGAILFVRNQEEKDYYSGLQLMYSQPINILTLQDYDAELGLTQSDPYHMLPHTFYATYPALIPKSF